MPRASPVASVPGNARMITEFLPFLRCVFGVWKESGNAPKLLVNITGTEKVVAEDSTRPLGGSHAPRPPKLCPRGGAATQGAGPGWGCWSPTSMQGTISWGEAQAEASGPRLCSRTVGGGSAQASFRGAAGPQRGVHQNADSQGRLRVSVS